MRRPTLKIAALLMLRSGGQPNLLRAELKNGRRTDSALTACLWLRWTFAAGGARVMRLRLLYRSAGTAGIARNQVREPSLRPTFRRHHATLAKPIIAEQADRRCDACPACDTIRTHPLTMRGPR